ncbi:MAG: hypothetical protein A2Y74_05590 [Actinobacteria bacterium RBG_13_63_9]|nr:MAG: hypothetical protein A2Y74_05590 [Actinobacteria bacterium RBG_13_63_9]
MLLIDSDAEILDPNVVRTMKTAMDDDRVFGCGFSHGPAWLDERHGVGTGVGYYPERMWMSLTMLRVSHIREALAAGESFNVDTQLKDARPSGRISRQWNQSLSLRPVAEWALPWSKRFKKAYSGQEPDYMYYDTGARIYQFLRHQKALHFVGLPAEVFHGRYVGHYHGVTRSTLNAHDTNCATLDEVSREIEERLQQVYGYRL